MSPLRAFLAEAKARPKARKAVAEGALLSGRPVTELFDWWEGLFDRLETSPEPLAIKLHDGAVQIVSRKSESVKKRYLALIELLEPFDSERHRH
jgi:hypothetical protein